MRIGYFVVKYPYEHRYRNYQYGGASVVAYQLAMGIVKKGHDVKVFTTSRDRHYRESVEKGPGVYRYGTDLKILTSNFSSGYFRGPLKHEIDIAHAHFDVVPGPFSAMRYADKKGVPLILTYHGDWEENFGAIYRRAGVAVFNRLFVDKLLSRSQVIITPSKTYADRSRFLTKYRDKVVTVPNGINIDDYSLPLSKQACREKIGVPERKKMVLFLGYLSPYKGADVLIRAMPMVLRQVPEALLIIAGTGQMAEALMALSRDISVEDHVRFAGFVDDENKPHYLKACDVFVLPSTMSTECFPVSILEAMSSYAPVVASDIGGIPDAVRDGFNGLLARPGNPESLSEAIVRILKNDDLAAGMGKNGRQLIEKEYLWDNIIGTVEKLYEKCLDGCAN